MRINYWSSFNNIQPSLGGMHAELGIEDDTKTLLMSPIVVAVVILHSLVDAQGDDRPNEQANKRVQIEPAAYIRHR